VVIEALRARGAQVSGYDPVAMTEAGHIYRDDAGVSFAASALDAAKGADALIIMTEWKAFRSPDFDALRKALRQPVIFDGRNLYDPDVVSGHGFEYYAIGRGMNAPAASAAAAPRKKVGA
jgi:UDPglucose 6-dehydrogenase